MMHCDFMHRCLELAEQGRRNIGNGALVGAALVRDGMIIAEGFHKSFGTSHAERHVLENFTDTVQPGDVLYVNLEPCCHTGKTPPCTDILLERGVKHVVIGMVDPDPRVAGKGIALLRQKGVTIEGPILRAECEWLNRGFISVRTIGRPWITLKSSRTSDGKIANDDGSPLAITSAEQNKWSHSHLRSTHDAILVGVQTIMNDDPILDCRLSQRPDYHPWRIILDPHRRIPSDAKVLTDKNAASTIVIIAEEKMADAQSITKNGAIVLPVRLSGDSFDWVALWETLLASHGSFNGLTSILVEGGKRTWDSFKNVQMVDMQVMHVGTK